MWIVVYIAAMFGKRRSRSTSLLKEKKKSKKLTRHLTIAIRKLFASFELIADVGSYV